MLVQGKNRCINCFRELNTDEDMCSCGYEQSKYKPKLYWLQPGTMLDNRYCLGRVIGAGGFGITYVGYDVNLDMRLAIKEFYINGVNSRNSTMSDEIDTCYNDKEEVFEIYREKFINEAKVLAKFNDEDGVVSVHNFFKSNNTAYIIMEFLEGMDLKEYLGKKGTLSVNETLDIFRPIMKTLDKVHSMKLIHRDISPDNIIFTKNGKVKLLDFGAAKDYADEKRSFSVVLKHGYAPMEQYQRHGNQGPWTDVYALSATIYKCITGTTPLEAVARGINDELKSPDEISSNCTAAVGKVLMKGLSLDIEARYQSVNELMVALEEACGDKEPVKVVVNNETLEEKVVSDYEDETDDYIPTGGEKTVPDNTDSGQQNGSEVGTAGGFQGGNQITQTTQTVITQNVIQQPVQNPPQKPKKKSRVALILGIIIAFAIILAAGITVGKALLGNNGENVSVTDEDSPSKGKDTIGIDDSTRDKDTTKVSDEGDTDSDGDTNSTEVVDNSQEDSTESQVTLPEKYKYLTEVKEGDTVEFGDYNGYKDWIVLKNDGSEVMLIASDIVDEQPYNNDRSESCCWSNCSLRTWLNSNYYNVAFGNDEKALIADTPVENVTDKVYLLSAEEARQFFSSDDNRIAHYVKEQAYGSTAPYGWIWWLRDPVAYYGSDFYASDVGYDGGVYEGDYLVDGKEIGVRPVINLDVSGY